MSIQPLTGIKVLDFSTLLPGPLASLILAEAGADVLKIERPGGEDLRGYPPKWGKDSSLFAAMNRGKSSLELDLRNPQSLEDLRPHIEAADIVLEQFRPGVMARLGLDYDSVKAINPNIIYCSITAYGQTGPRASQAGHDLNFVANAGVLSFSTGPDDNPSLPPYLVGDIGGGTMPAVINILLALRQRDITGKGTWLDISMADQSLVFGAFQQAAGQIEGEFPGNGNWLLTGASPRYQLYPASDGRLIACAALEQKFWDAFCDIIKLDENLRKDWQNPEATIEAIAHLIEQKPSSHWLPLFEQADCCVCLVQNFEEAMSDPHFVERGLFQYQVSNNQGETIKATIVPVAPQFRDNISLIKSYPER